MRYLAILLLLGLFLNLGALTAACSEMESAQQKQKKEAEMKQGQMTINEQETDAVADNGEVTAEEVKAKTEEAYVAAKKYLAKQMKEYQRTLHLKLDEVNRELDQLHQRIQQEKPKVKDKLEEEQEELEQQREILQKKLDDLNEKAAERLGEVKKRLNETLVDLQQFIDETLDSQ